MIVQLGSAPAAQRFYGIRHDALHSPQVCYFLPNARPVTCRELARFGSAPGLSFSDSASSARLNRV